MRIVLLAAAAAFAVAAPLEAAPPKRGAVKARVAKAPKPAFGTFGFDVAGMDRSVSPGTDFGRFASGTYLKTLEIPADKPSYGMFTKLRDLSQSRTRTIVEAAAAQRGAAKGSETQKVGDFYASFVDEAAIEAKGLTPLGPRLAEIAAIKDRAGLAQAMGEMNRDGTTVPIGLGPLQDLKNPDIYTVFVGQGGLGMPDRDFYIDTANPKFAEVRGKYQAYMARLLELGGIDDAAAKAKKVYALEEKIARAHWTQVEQRQLDKIYNPVARAALEREYPGVGWTPLLTAAGVNARPELTMAHPSALKLIARLVEDEPLETWRAYLAFHTLDRWAPYLPKAFVDARFAFRGTALGGQPANQPRWKRGVDATSEALGEAAGKLYVQRYFNPAAKAKADELVRNIVAAMDDRLGRLDWMDPATRVAAKEKLGVFTAKIGYPETWRDYSKLDVVRGDALGNAMRSSRFAYQREVDKIGKPIDRTEWAMTPMTVNAYANPLWNEIVFPAAILQPPFFDPAADPAVNYGGIGAVIGHEITHHFDDQGRKFDKRGTLNEWWTKEDVKRFTALTDKVVKQYAAYEPLPGLRVNGELTLGENIADLAGVTIAYDAYKKSLKGRPAPVIGGYTGDQRFFLGFAQIWRQKYRDAALLQQTTTDPHTAGFLRPNVVRNLDAWYAAFPSQRGEALYLTPAERIRVW